MTLSCHCGQVRIEVAQRPEFIHECNCSLCAKSGVRWGYFDPSEVRVEGETGGYRRSDKPEPGADVRFCSRCSCTTHFVLTPEAQARHGNAMAGVNMRLADAADLTGIELRFPDGAAWDGAGAFGYVRDAQVLG